MTDTRKGTAPISVSWMDRLFDFIERIPIPTVLVYPLAYVVLGLAQHLALWTDGTAPAGEMFAPAWLESIWLVALPAAWHFLRSASATGIDRFRPALEVDDIEFAAVRTRFTRLSARTGWIITVVIVLCSVAIWPVWVSAAPWMDSPTSRVLSIALLVTVFPLNVGFLVAVVRLLLAIPRIYRRVTRIDLFRLSPLYALSTVTARVGVVFIGFVVIGIVTGSTQYEGASEASATYIAVFYGVLWSVLAVVAFVVPLLGIHHRMDSVKGEALLANSALLGQGYTDLQAAAVRGDVEDISRLQATVGALSEYQTAISKVSTWPWNPATVRGFATALLVPISVWGLQQVLLRVVA